MGEGWGVFLGWVCGGVLGAKDVVMGCDVVGEPGAKGVVEGCDVGRRFAFPTYG